VPLSGVCDAERAPLLGIIKRGVASPLGVYPPWGVGKSLNLHIMEFGRAKSDIIHS
jgi:hypothetical protein